MKWIILVFALVGLALAFLLHGRDAPEITGNQGINGNFYAMVHLLPNSRDHVRLDIYEDFTCPACQRLEADGLPKILDNYGSRVTIRRHYLAGPATEPFAKILYDVANSKGLGDEVAKALFAAKLNHNQNSNNLSRVRAIARRHLLERDFDIALRDGSGLVKLREEWKRTNGKVAFFPFVVFENDIAANADVSNIMKILDSILKKTDVTPG